MIKINIKNKILILFICCLMVGCTNTSKYNKYLEEVSNREFYGNPEKINTNPIINLDLDKDFFSESLNRNISLKEIINVGDELVKKYLGPNYDNFLRRIYMYKGYEKINLNNKDLKISNAKFDKGYSILKRYDFINGDIEKTLDTEENYKASIGRVVRILNVLFSKEQINIIKEIELINDSKIDSPMYVLYSENKDGMKLGINLSVLESEYYKNDEFLMYSIIHEYAHIFSMYTNQLLNTDVINNQENYIWEILEGYKDDSYLKKFYNTFWKDIPRGWTTTKYKSQEEMVNFYLLNEDYFSNGYASTNVHEDFAESFKFFITEKINFDTSHVLEKKVKFFYQFPELVDLRTQILNNMVKLK